MSTELVGQGILFVVSLGDEDPLMCLDTNE
jgi:hypothetical protein